MSSADIYDRCRDTLDYLVPLLSKAGWCTTDNFTESKLGIVCGSGLGQLYESLDQIQLKVPYSSIPNFSRSHVVGHANQLVFGSVKLNGKSLPVILMLGRLHCYEGLLPSDTSFPIIMLRLLGVSAVLITNASGGVNKNMKKGDIMIIRDHINLPSMTGSSPLVGSLLDAHRLSEITAEYKKYDVKFMFDDSKIAAFDRFPNLNQLYDRTLSQNLYEAFLVHFPDREIHSGVYFYNYGPSYESPAEIEFVKRIGGDAVGMSTLPEVIMARELNMKVFAFALVTNECSGLKETNEEWISDKSYRQFQQDSLYDGPSHIEVIDASKHRAQKISLSIKEFLHYHGMQFLAN